MSTGIIDQALNKIADLINSTVIVDQTPTKSYSIDLTGFLAWQYTTGTFVRVELPFVTKNTDYAVYYDETTTISDVGVMSTVTVIAKYNNAITLQFPHTGTPNVVHRLSEGKIRIVFA